MSAAIPEKSIPARKSAPKKAPGLRQTMSDLHIWTGLLVGWLLYAMFLTGTVSYFRDEISQWMRPELPAQHQVPDTAEVAQRLIGTLSTMAPDSPQWSVGLPDERNNIASAFWRNPQLPGRRGFESATFDPATGQKLNVRETSGGDFFYRFHFNFHYIPVLWGRWLAGICAMFMLVAIVSGVITHKKIFIDFFTFRWGKGQRSWLDAHNALSVFGLPFHLMITYSGLVTLMLLYMPWGSDAAFKTPPERLALTAEMGSFVPAGQPSGRRAELAPVADMVRQAQARWGRDNVGRVLVNNPGDVAAQVVVVRGDKGRASVSPQHLVFDGADGRLAQVRDKVGAAAETRGVMYALHLGRFADTVTRWLYFLVSLAGTAMVGTGLVLWTVKRRAKLPDPHRPYFGFRLVERLNIATIAGLSIAMAGMLWAGAASLALLPLLNALTTERPLWRSLTEGDWVFAGLELTLWALAALHVALAVRTARHQFRVRPPRQAAARRRPKANEVEAEPALQEASR